MRPKLIGLADVDEAGLSSRAREMKHILLRLDAADGVSVSDFCARGDSGGGVNATVHQVWNWRRWFQDRFHLETDRGNGGPLPPAPETVDGIEEGRGDFLEIKMPLLGGADSRPAFTLETPRGLKLHFGRGVDAEELGRIAEVLASC